MRRNLTLAALAAGCLALAPATRAQNLVTSSFSAGSPGCEDKAPDIAASPGGSFVLVWTRECGLFPVRLVARPYNAEGRPLGPEVDLGEGYAPSLAALPDGGYALASVGAAPVQGSELRLARLDGRGRRIGVAEIADPGAPAFSIHETPRLAVDRSGNLGLIWKRHQPAVDTLFLLRRYAADLSPRADATVFADRPTSSLSSPDLAFADDGDLLVAWSLRVFDEFPNYTAIFGRRYPADGTPPGPSFRLTVPGPGGKHRDPHLLGAQRSGGWLMTWQIAVIDGSYDSRFAHLATNTLHLGQAIGAAVQGQGVRPIDLAFGTDSAGNVLVLAEEDGGPLAARLFNPSGTAVGEPVQVLPFGIWELDGPRFSRSAGGSFLTAYAEAGRVVQSQELSFPMDWDLHGRIVRRACAVADHAACLLFDQFGVEVLRTRAGGGVEYARPIRLDESGTLFAFSGQIPEVAVRMKQTGTEAQLTYAATTNGAITIRVTDRVTGEVKTATKPAGRFASGRIDGLGANLDPLAAPADPEPSAISAIPAAPPLGLFGGRFKVEVTRPGAGGGQPASGALFDDRRAVFRFGGDLDLTVALIEGQPNNGKLWVYLGDLSDGAYRVKITDSTTGKVKVYTKPAGRLLTRVDRQAF